MSERHLYSERVAAILVSVVFLPLKFVLCSSEQRQRVHEIFAKLQKLAN